MTSSFPSRIIFQNLHGSGTFGFLKEKPKAVTKIIKNWPKKMLLLKWNKTNWFKNHQANETVLLKFVRLSFLSCLALGKVCLPAKKLQHLLSGLKLWNHHVALFTDLTVKCLSDSGKQQKLKTARRQRWLVRFKKSTSFSTLWLLWQHKVCDEVILEENTVQIRFKLKTQTFCLKNGDKLSSVYAGHLE